MKNKYLFGIFACAILVSFPSLSLADHGESNDSDSDSDDSTSVEIEIEDSSSKPLRENRGPSQTDIKTRIREKQEFRQENRGDIRTLASTTRMERKEIRTESRGEIRDIREEGKMMRKNASSSMERKEIRKNVRKDVFQAQQKRLVAQLELALTNLKQVRARIISRIEKSEATNRDMTEARKLILIADTKINLAAQEIASLATYTSPVTASSTATTTDSSEIELSKPREFSNAAIKAVKAAHKSLVDVIVAIAQNMGVKGEVQATTTSATTTTQ